MQDPDCKGWKCETRKSDVGLDTDDGIACADDGDVAPIVFSFFSFATTAAIKCCQCFIFRWISHIVDAIAVQVSVQVSIVWHEKSADFCRPIISADFYRSCVMGLRLRKTDPCTKFEVPRLTRYEAMNGGAKCRKWGGLGCLVDTQGHGQCHHLIERIRLPIWL